jgi:hypothetical protein
MPFDEKQKDKRRRNPQTFFRHRRQVFWQVYFPLFVFVLMGLSAGILSIVAPPEGSRLWADIALIFILLIIMLGITLCLLLTIPLIFLTRRISSAIPHAFFQGQEFMERLKLRVKAISDTAVEPILRYQSAREGLMVLGRRLRREKFTL